MTPSQPCLIPKSGKSGHFQPQEHILGQGKTVSSPWNAAASLVKMFKKKKGFLNFFKQNKYFGKGWKSPMVPQKAPGLAEGSGSGWGIPKHKFCLNKGLIPPFLHPLPIPNSSFFSSPSSSAPPKFIPGLRAGAEPGIGVGLGGSGSP